MRRCPKPERRPTTSAGFTLVEIAVVIVVLSLLLAMIAGIATAMVGQQRREVTRQKLAGVETALALFVSQNKRLPCPADGRMAAADVDAGLERPGVAGACQVVTGTANSQTHGVVPWRTLGLAESDVTDGWGNRLTYRAAPELTLANAMDLTACDPAGADAGVLVVIGGVNQYYCNTACSTTTFPAACTPPSAFARNKGLKVRNLLATVTLVMDPTANPSPTGAAYVVISHGENGVGSYSSAGVLQAGTVGSGTLEAANNAADVTFNHGSSMGLANANAFVDDFAVYAEGTGHFDDFVLRPSILTLATKAQLGPRAH